MGENLSLPDKLIKNTIRENLLKKYTSNTLIRGLIQLVPYGAVADNVLSVAYNNILVERSNVFFDELALGQIELTTDLINNEDFLHAYFSTYKAAIYTKQREKIRFFARLLIKGLTTGLISKADEFDDYSKILDELTFREIFILFILNKYESKCDIKDFDNLLNKTNSYWNDFEKEISEALNISKNELESLLSRLERTGCFCFIKGSFYDNSGYNGYLTETYFKLRYLIEIKDEDFVYYRNTYEGF